MTTINTCIENLRNLQVEFEEVILAEPVHSVADVQAACGCKASEVLKTLLFIGDAPVMVILPGDKKAEVKKIQSIIGGGVLRLATPKEVKALTGYDVGSVSPFGLSSSIRQIADEHVQLLRSLYLGSGENNMLIKMTARNFIKAFTGHYAPVS